MSGHRHTTTLTPAEQAIAKHGSVAEAWRRTQLPYGELRRAWQQINAANRAATGAVGRTPPRNIRIPDALWDELTMRAGSRGRAEFIIAAIRKALDAP